MLLCLWAFKWFSGEKLCCEERHITIAIRSTLTFKLNLAIRACPSPAPLRCKEADGFDPWSHFLTRLRCQITFWPRKHLQVAWATSDLAVIDRSMQFFCFFFSYLFKRWSNNTPLLDKKQNTNDYLLKSGVGTCQICSEKMGRLNILLYSVGKLLCQIDAE